MIFADEFVVAVVVTTTDGVVFVVTPVVMVVCISVTKVRIVKIAQPGTFFKTLKNSFSLKFVKPLIGTMGHTGATWDVKIPRSEECSQKFSMIVFL